MTKAFLTGLAVILGLSAPVAADPTLGLGVTLTFGSSAKVDTGIGLRLFSNDKRNSTVATLGVDYMLQSKRIRPSLGIAYLNNNSFVGLDFGYDYGLGQFDIGVGLGGVKTKKAAAPAAAAAPVILPPPPPPA